jgi:hypothetical protein
LMDGLTDEPKNGLVNELMRWMDCLNARSLKRSNAQIT